MKLSGKHWLSYRRRMHFKERSLRSCLSKLQTSKTTGKNTHRINRNRAFERSLEDQGKERFFSNQVENPEAVPHLLHPDIKWMYAVRQRKTRNRLTPRKKPLEQKISTCRHRLKPWRSYLTSRRRAPCLKHTRKIWRGYLTWRQIVFYDNNVSYY